MSGIWLWYASGASLISLMRSILYGSVSIMRLVFLLFLPFLLSALAVFCFGPRSIYPVAFGKGLLFSFVSMGVFSCFGSGGWLVWMFLCFSEIVTVPLLYWFWLRLLGGNHVAGLKESLLLLAPVFLIGSIDHCLITPFFADLIKFIER